MYKACIIDDENNSREVLELMISENHPEITISGTASNITEGMELIRRHQPDILFLDVEMPGGSGFDLVRQLQEPLPQIIFAQHTDTMRSRLLNAVPWRICSSRCPHKNCTRQLRKQGWRVIRYSVACNAMCWKNNWVQPKNPPVFWSILLRIPKWSGLKRWCVASLKVITPRSTCQMVQRCWPPKHSRTLKPFYINLIFQDTP